MFKRIVFSACIAGLLGGIVLTGAQLLGVTPTIVEAERYESAGPTRLEPSPGDAAAPVQRTQEHAGAWKPDDGVERTLWTALANVGLGIGFALLLVAAYSLRGSVSPGQGLLWGLGGYVTFFISPALGLAPELPGADAAALGDRQGWWLMTVTLTGVGLALLGLAKRWSLRIVGIGLLIVPHAIGAPPSELHGDAPLELAQAFVVAAAVANAVFWAVLGVGSAMAFRKLA